MCMHLPSGCEITTFDESRDSLVDPSTSSCFMARTLYDKAAMNISLCSHKVPKFVKKMYRIARTVP